MKKKPKQAANKPKPEPTVPPDKIAQFEELVDRFMDKHNMTGDEARRRAYSSMGLADAVMSISPSGIDLTEGIKRALRRARKNPEATRKEIMRQGARGGIKQYNIEVSDRYLTKSALEDLKGEKEMLDANIAELSRSLIPVPHWHSLVKEKDRIEMDVQRAKLRELGRRVGNRVFASYAGEDVYLEQPVVKKAEEEEKSNFLKRMIRMRDLGLT